MQSYPSIEMSSIAPALVSEQEFLSMPETSERIELLDGEVLVSPSPSYWHQELLMRLARHLRDWAEASPQTVMVGVAPLDVRFGPDRILQPDCFVIFGAIARDHEGPITKIPNLCVEVLSSNRTYDRMAKRLVYAEAGVSELWTVELNGTVERWYGDGLGERARHEASLASPLLPGFRLDLERLRA